MPSIFHLMNPSLRYSPRVMALTRFGKNISQWAMVARQHAQHTETLIDWALRTKVTRLVVWGGDGTFHRVVKGLWRRGALDQMELALVPSGTCNDLARYFGLHWSSWGRWESAVPHGRLAHLTLARIAWKADPAAGEFDGEDIFVNNAGFGRPRSSFERKDSPLQVLRSFRPLRLTARWSDGELKARAFMAFAALGPNFSGGLHFEKVSPEDGLMRMYLVPALSKIHLGWRLLRGRFGRPLLDRSVTKITAKKVTLLSETGVWPQADGEPPPAKAAKHVEFEVLPEKVRVWVI